MTDHVENENRLMWERERQHLVDALDAKDRELEGLRAAKSAVLPYVLTALLAAMIAIGVTATVISEANEFDKKTRTCSGDWLEGYEIGKKAGRRELAGLAETWPRGTCAGLRRCTDEDGVHAVEVTP